MPLARPFSSKPILERFALDHKVCLVTGGARGIGLEVVRAFAEAGANVAFTFLKTNPKTAEQISHSICDSTSQRVQAFRLDVTNRAEVAKVFHQVVQAFGRIDVVVANAGVCRQISSLDYTEESFDKDYAVNVYGAMWTAQAAGNIFKTQGHGNLIITASVSSVLVNVPQPQTAYNSSKAAAAHMGRNLAVEWIDFARVNCVSPGYVATDMTLKQPPKVQADWLSMIPARRMADPDELKGLYVFLASDASSYITGANIIIDGAYSIP